MTSRPPISLRRKLLFSLPLWILALVLARKVYRKQHRKLTPAAIQDRECTTTMDPRGLYLQDPEIGWGYKDGMYQVKTVCDGLEIPMEWALNIREGYRITAPPGEVKERPEIWLFGCSFLFGWGIEDDRTAAWLLQKKFPQWTVRNFAIPGYGTTQFLVLFQRMLKDRPPPRAAVFAHGAFHAPRNINPSIVVDGDLTGFPAAVVESGVVKDIRFVKAPLSEDAEGVTLAVVKRLFEFCREKKIDAVLAYINGNPADPAARLWSEGGSPFVDLTDVDYASDVYNLKPFDGHPNERGHRVYAEKIAQALIALEKK